MKLSEMLKTLQMVHVGTVEGAYPKLRPMTMIYYAGGFWFATGSKDAKTAQLKDNPHAIWSLIIPGEGCTGYLKGEGMMREERDLTVRKAIADHAKFLYDYWQDAADPDFILYQMQISALRYMKPGAMYEEDITEVYLQDKALLQ
ncbi:MAG: pyridoxamine 5'-phosphate oxidase family protein [Candidatus Cloacimonetes bacterium]|nr:pyridoxamine 5'-phosphate oxidase family protein [Candidatus Cloacimonadota bacterium]MDD4806445.1 pyridoxamine 5'-phosphate oxidase family protein [Candidatus Cloacimonadota bacterium]